MGRGSPRQTERGGDDTDTRPCPGPKVYVHLEERKEAELQALKAEEGEAEVEEEALKERHPQPEIWKLSLHPNPEGGNAPSHGCPSRFS